jgi:hypothetical protein
VRPLGWVAAVFALVAGLVTKPSGGGGDATLIIGGGTEGYLAPCGCVSPMTGGIKRRATAVKQLRDSRPGAVYLEMGPFAGAQTRQHEIKAETVAEIFNTLKPSAIALGHEDAALGLGVVGSLQRLSGDRIFSSQIPSSDAIGWPQFVAAGPFDAGAFDPKADEVAPPLGVTGRDLDQTVEALIADAEAADLLPVALFQGDLEQARALAKAHPRLKLIVYRHHGTPPPDFEFVGETALVTPGEKGKYILSVTFKSGRPTSLRLIALGPENRDDPDAARLFAHYQDRVRDDKLLEMLPRVETPGFAGSAACQPCHAEAWDVWKGSQHAHALKTLESQGHERDPDCVPCHVVALDSAKGFRSRIETPDLADVGCESCHGPGADHVAKPMHAKMPKIDEKACVSCHNPENSPAFDFKTYWPKVAHGSGGKTGG